jgi:hypothetical protein
MLAHDQAYGIAAQWGSFMSVGDPGACFYGFRFNDGRPQSEAHRARCLAYIDEELIPLAEDEVKRTYRYRTGKRAHEHRNAVQDLAELKVLRDYFCAAPVRESEPSPILA